MMSGAPVLIYNNEVVEFSNSTPWVTSPPQNLRPKIAARTAIAIPSVQNHILLINVDGADSNSSYGPCYIGSPYVSRYGMTTPDLAQFIAQFFHPQSALNFDGGGTSTMCIKGHGNNGGVTGGLGVINIPDMHTNDSSCPLGGTNNVYNLQRLLGCAISVVPN